MNEEKALEQALRSVYTGIPETVHQRVEETLSAILQSQKPRRRKLIFWMPAAAVGIVFLCIFASGFVSPTMAQYLERMPLVGIAFKRAGDPGIQNYAGNAGLHLTATDQDISITLDQAVYDGARLSIGFIHDSNVRISLSPAKRLLLIDGQEIYGSGGAVSKEIGDDQTATVYHVVPSKELPDSFQVTLTIHEVILTEGSRTETVEGSWRFRLHVDKISEGIFIRNFDPPLARTHEDTTIEVTGIVRTPLTTKVTFNLTAPEKYQNHLTGENQPEEIIFHQLRFGLTDDRGVQLQPLSQGGRGGAPGEPFQYEALFEPVHPEAEQVILQSLEETIRMKKVGDGMYSGATPPEVVRYDMPDAFPFTVKQGDAGEITFHRIEFYPEKTMITYSIQGLIPHEQDGAWWMEDDAGNKFDFDRYDQIRLNDQPFTYEVAFPPVDPARLKLAVVQLKAPKLIKELEIPIPLK